MDRRIQDGPPDVGDDSCIPVVSIRLCTKVGWGRQTLLSDLDHHVTPEVVTCHPRLLKASAFDIGLCVVPYSAYSLKDQARIGAVRTSPAVEWSIHVLYNGHRIVVSRRR